MQLGLLFSVTLLLSLSTLVWLTPLPSELAARHKHVDDRNNTDHFAAFVENVQCFGTDGPAWVLADWKLFIEWCKRPIGTPPKLNLDDLDTLVSCAKGVAWEQIHNGIGAYTDAVVDATMPHIDPWQWRNLGAAFLLKPIKEGLIVAELLDAVVYRFSMMLKVASEDEWAAEKRGEFPGVTLKGQELEARMAEFYAHVLSICNKLGCPKEKD